MSQSTYIQTICALRFFYTRTLSRKIAIERLPFPRRERKLPLILSREEVKALLEAPRNLRQRTMLAVCTVPDLGSRKLPNSKRTTSTAHATCSGSAVAKDGRIDRLCCRPNCWNYCATIGEPGGPQAGFFPPPIPPGPSRPKPCSWLAGKRGERRAFLNLLIRTCCGMPSLHILLRPVAEQDLDGAGAAKTPSFFRCASSATAAARSSCGNCAQPSATEPCASPANFDPWLLPAFEALCEQAGKIEWVVHSKPPFGGPERVLKYLARYTHRVAISNHRLCALENGRVSFEWKDYAHQGQNKIMTLDAIEFMRRFLLHVLPSGLVRIRQFGFLANRFRTRNLRLCRDLLAVGQTLAPSDSHNPADTDGPDHSSCPICKLGQLILIEVSTPNGPWFRTLHDTIARPFLVEFPHPASGSADLCLHVPTQRVQVCSNASPTISILAAIPPHDSSCSVPGILGLVLVIMCTACQNERPRFHPSRKKRWATKWISARNHSICFSYCR